MDRSSPPLSYGCSNTTTSPRSQGCPRRSSQLPTPEASRSGYDLYEDDRREGAGSGSDVRRPILHPPTDQYENAVNGSCKRLSSRRDSCSQRSPNSPPYHVTDSQRPSLPPLKTILPDGISSPPSTPSIPTRAFQPAPREPIYTSSTYKPPALYPHKKQRTDAFLEPGPWINHPSRGSSPSSLRTPIEPTLNGTPRGPRDSFSAPPVPLNPFLSGVPRRDSTYEGSATPSSVQSDYSRANGVNDTYYVREAAPEVKVYRAEHYARDFERGYDEYRPDAQYELAVRSGYPERDPASQTRQSEYYHSHTSPNLHAGPYMGSQPALFIPGHGDYHLSKSRKRSNLPKESTDIMKQWFDQNITNPYPSEDQKAIFSNATGISMNQVSNWFINHRRRCPELRDKREKARGRERDDR